jgi:hypothetical protein
MSSVSPLRFERRAVITNEIGGHKVPIYPFQVPPEFFQTMGIPLMRGRNLLPGEKKAVIVSESLPGFSGREKILWANSMR